MSKLQNIKAIQNMLSGTHKMQTRQTHYYGKTSSDILEENILERDDNGKPKIWIEIDPITKSRTRVTQNNGWKSRLNEKFWLTHKECFDCVIKLETKLRHDPKEWKKYQLGIMKKNALSFFKDADIDIEDLEKYLTTKSELVQNADGDIETLDATMTKKKFKGTILKEYKEYKKRILSELEHGE